MSVDSIRIFIGFEPREQEAYDVCVASFKRFGRTAEPLREDVLRINGLLTRPVDARGQMWDLNSEAPQSTRFAVARFYALILAHTGWAFVVDCDTVAKRDPFELCTVADPRYAVMVVKHPPMHLGGTKMDGQIQTAYHRKLWSSVMLINCDHPANRRVNLQMLNQWPGRDLHGFKWLHDEEIGELAPEWNWLVGIQPRPVNPALIHYTLGTPNMPGHENSEAADEWFEQRQVVSSR